MHDGCCEMFGSYHDNCFGLQWFEEVESDDGDGDGEEEDDEDGSGDDGDDTDSISSSSSSSSSSASDPSASTSDAPTLAAARSFLAARDQAVTPRPFET